MRGLRGARTAHVDLDLDGGGSAGAPPVICAQNTPVRITYDAPARSGRPARIVVHSYHGGGSALADRPIVVDFDLDTLKLSGIRCPPAS